MEKFSHSLLFKTPTRVNKGENENPLKGSKHIQNVRHITVTKGKMKEKYEKRMKGNHEWETCRGERVKDIMENEQFELILK